MKLAMIDIARATAEHFHLDLKTLRGDCRAQQIYRPRQLAMALCRDHASKSLPEIGRFFGDRDHTSVLSALRDFRATRYTGMAVMEARAAVLDSARVFAAARIAQERDWVEKLKRLEPFPPPPNTIARPTIRPKNVMAIARALECGVLVRVLHTSQATERRSRHPVAMPSEFTLPPERLRAGRA